MVAKISQPINRHYVDLNHDLNQSQCGVAELAAYSAARQSSASAVANSYQCKQKQQNLATEHDPDFAVILLPKVKEVTTNKIYTYYGNMYKLYLKIIR